jgi:ABC-2 type transport system ATP-binding protein
MIQLKNITKRFGNKTVLQDISFDFELNKVYGIVGENGAGKTTLFRCMSGLESFDGAVDTSFPVLKNVLGYLQTEPYFFSRITGGEYLQLFANARGIKGVDFDAHNIFDLPLQKYAEDYSTGMKKKLALLAVLLQQNDVLILDEPFNGVDIHSNIMIKEIIEQLRDAGKTVFVCSHIFSTLTDICDEILFMEDGSFKEVYLPDEFDALEAEMKQKTVTEKLQHLSF